MGKRGRPRKIPLQGSSPSRSQSPKSTQDVARENEEESEHRSTYESKGGDALKRQSWADEDGGEFLNVPIQLSNQQEFPYLGALKMEEKLCNGKMRFNRRRKWSII
ncbi:hypothetical protein Droror1_Dr00028259 [Drosera rotundifolia]